MAKIQPVAARLRDAKSQKIVVGPEKFISCFLSDQPIFGRAEPKPFEIIRRARGQDREILLEAANNPTQILAAAKALKSADWENDIFWDDNCNAYLIWAYVAEEITAEQILTGAMNHLVTLYEQDGYVVEWIPLLEEGQLNPELQTLNIKPELDESDVSWISELPVSEQYILWIADPKTEDSIYRRVGRLKLHYRGLFGSSYLYDQKYGQKQMVQAISHFSAGAMAKFCQVKRKMTILAYNPVAGISSSFSIAKGIYHRQRDIIIPLRPLSTQEAKRIHDFCDLLTVLIHDFYHWFLIGLKPEDSTKLSLMTANLCYLLAKLRDQSVDHLTVRSKSGVFKEFTLQFSPDSAFSLARTASVVLMHHFARTVDMDYTTPPNDLHLDYFGDVFQDLVGGVNKPFQNDPSFCKLMAIYFVLHRREITSDFDIASLFGGEFNDTSFFATLDKIQADDLIFDIPVKRRRI